MKSAGSFFKSTILGGLLVIVPLFLVYLLLAEVVETLVAIVQPVVEMFPGDWVISEMGARFLALAILLGLCFLTGLATRTRLGSSTGRWMERTVLQRVPGYKMARTLTKQFTGSEDASNFAPAVMRFGEDLVLVYIIEEHENGYFTLLLPGSPVGTAGGLRYVPGERVTRLKVPLGKVFNCITQYGIGSGPLFIPHTPGAEGTEPETENG